MDDGLKQRLVGAIVLVALAVIFLPQLFDKETPYQVVKEPIPQPPAKVAEPAFIEQQRQRVAERQAELASQQAENQAGTEQEPIELVTDEVLEQAVTAVEKVPPQSSTSQQEGSHKAFEKDSFEKDTSEKDKKTIPSLDKQGVPISWTLQLATFSNQANADKLLSELRTAGYKAYSKQVAKGQKTLTRVFVGPSLSKDSVIRQQQSIAKRWSLSGLVMRFKP